MVDTRLAPVQRGPEQGRRPAVYCAEVAPLRLADGTPLYLEWIVEGEGGVLYRVPAQPGGWLQRKPYDGQAERLRPVSAGEANVILRLTSAGPDGSIARGYSLDLYHLQAP